MAGLALLGAIVVVGGGAVVARTVLEDETEAKVREVAVGTWKCDEHFEGELQSVYVVGITSDGGIGVGEQRPEDDQPVGTGKMPTQLAEGGAWTVDGLTVELSFPMVFPGEYGETFPAEQTMTYTGDADPPSEIRILDRLSGETTPSRWSADISDDRARFVEVKRSGGDLGVMDYDCVRLSSDEPKLVKPG